MSLSIHTVCAAVLLLMAACQNAHTGASIDDGESRYADSVLPPDISLDLDNKEGDQTKVGDDGTDNGDETTDEEKVDKGTCNNVCVCAEPVLENCGDWTHKDLSELCTNQKTYKSRMCDKVTECELPDNPCEKLECETTTKEIKETDSSPLKGTKKCMSRKPRCTIDYSPVVADESIQC